MRKFSIGRIVIIAITLILCLSTISNAGIVSDLANETEMHKFLGDNREIQEKIINELANKDYKDYTADDYYVLVMTAANGGMEDFTKSELEALAKLDNKKKKDIGLHDKVMVMTPIPAPFDPTVFGSGLSWDELSIKANTIYAQKVGDEATGNDTSEWTAEEINKKMGDIYTIYHTGEYNTYTDEQKEEFKSEIQDCIRRGRALGLNVDNIYEILSQIAFDNGEEIDEVATGSANYVKDDKREPRTGKKEQDPPKVSYIGEPKKSPDEIIEEGKDFLDRGKENQGEITISGDKVKNASNMIYNVLFAVGIGIAALIGIYLGIKMMMSSAEDKASIKEALLPYFVGVIIMFASFSIWKLILILLQAVDNV